MCVPLIRSEEFRAQYMVTDTLGVVNPPRINTFLIGQSSARPGSESLPAQPGTPGSFAIEGCTKVPCHGSLIFRSQVSLMLGFAYFFC